MLRFRDYSIPKKLTWMNMLVSGTALGLACTAFIAYDLISFRETMDRNLSIQARIVGANSAAALLFDDPRAAEKNLSALDAAPNIVSAGIYKPDGHLFASYSRGRGSRPDPVPRMASDQTPVHWLKDRQIALIRPVVFQGKPIGIVYIRSDLQELIDRLIRYAMIVAAVLSASMLAALLTSYVFQKSISDPIVSLAETARVISRERVYSVRAPTTGNRDELAVLIGAFNEMLAQIQARDTALQSEIAGRRRAQEELHESEEALESKTRMLQLVLDSMGEGLIAADLEGRFMIWNDSATKLMGRNAADLPSEKWAPHYKVFMLDGVTPFPEDRLPLIRALHGESAQTEMMIDHPERANGVFLEVTARPLKNLEGHLFGGVAVLRDITEHKAAEREIQKLNQGLEARVIERTTQLEEANKELEAFTYSVSHDLRAPLRHMSGFTRILVEDFGPSLPEEAQEHLRRIECGALRMGQLVDELLSLTRVGRQTLSVQVTGLSPIIKEVLSMFELEAQGRQIEWKVAEMPFVECDPTLIRQVFQNLIGNALKYSRPRSRAVIEIGHFQENGSQVIFIRDNGVGFSMKYADKLFGVFQRLHRAEDFEGTGVGLATVQRIVQKHGGRIWAEAELDRGATFYFTLGKEHSVSENAAAAAGA